MPSLQRSDENPLGLEPFQGCAVAAVAIKVSNAGGGLHDPLEVDLETIDKVANIRIGDTVYLLLRADCNSVDFKPIKGEEDKLRYIPSFHVTDTTLVDEGWAVDKVNNQRDRIQRLRDQAAGSPPMFDEFGNSILPPLTLVNDEVEAATK